MHMFERKRGAGNEHSGSRGILGREETEMADAMSLTFIDMVGDDEFGIV